MLIILNIRHLKRLFANLIKAFFLHFILVLWPNLIKRHGGIVTDQLDVSSLSKVTDGYTPGHMVDVIKTVLTERRIKQVFAVCWLLLFS